MSLLLEPQTSHHTRYGAGVLDKPDYYDYALPEDGYLTTAGNCMVDNVLYQSENVNGFSYSEISTNPDHLLEPQTNHHPRCGTGSAPYNPDDYALPNEGYPTPSSTNGMVDNVLYQSGNVRDVYDPEISTCNKRSTDPDELLEPQTNHHPRCGTNSAPYNPDDYALPNEGYPTTSSSNGMVDNVLYQSGNVRDVYDPEISTCNKRSADTDELLEPQTNHHPRCGTSSALYNPDDYALPNEGYPTTSSSNGMVDNVLYQSGNVRDVYDPEISTNKTSTDYHTEGGMSSVSGNTGDYALPEDGYLTIPADSGMVDNDLYQLYWS